MKENAASKTFLLYYANTWSPSNLHPQVVKTILANYNKALPTEIVIINIQGVSGGKVNILGGGSTDYSE